jgi:hypothetical protein
MDMRKLASLSIAVLASFALAGAASATIIASVIGSVTPGTNVYTIVLTSDLVSGFFGYGLGVATTGSYGGVGTRTNPAPFNTPAGALDLTPCSNCSVHLWAAVTGGPSAPPGSYTVGTITLTVGSGDTVKPDFSIPGEGFLVGSTTVAADVINGITVIPEPTTASLLGLGIVGLLLAGRKSRA